MIRLSKQDSAEVLERLRGFSGALLADTLDRAGYALVAVSGVALHTAAERGDPETLPPAAPEQAERVDAWFDPSRSS